MKTHTYHFILLFCIATLFSCEKKQGNFKEKLSATQDSIVKNSYPDSLLDVTVVAGKKFGVLHNKISHDDLQKIYGENQIRVYRDTLRGRFYATTVLFEGQNNELQIVWHNEELLQYPNMCYFKHPKATWQADKGIKIGTKLSELIKLNEAPIEFIGFGNQMEGGLVQFKEGKLKDFGKYYTVFLGYDSKENPNIDSSLLGSATFSSHASVLKKLEIKIVKIQAYLNK